MIILMHLITLFWVMIMNPHQGYIQTKVENRNEPKHVHIMCKRLDLSRL